MITYVMYDREIFTKLVNKLNKDKMIKLNEEELHMIKNPKIPYKL